MKTTKKLSFLCALLMLTLACATGTTGGAASGDVPASWTEIEAPPLRDFEIQQPKRVELPNGLVIFLQPDHELPLIRGTAYFRGGSRDEPAGKAGLTSVYSQAWRNGGTTNRSGDEINQFLEDRAASVETGSDLDSTSLSFDLLADDFDEVFEVVVDLLENPLFPEDKIELAKTQLRTGIARRNDNASGIASREARRLVYGESSPYARNVEYDTLAAITRDDLLAWHEMTVNPNNMIIGVTGDFDVAEMEAEIRQAFADWERGNRVAVPQFTWQGAEPGVYLIEKDDVTQSNIRLVHEGIRRDNPDYFAARVFNEVFSGGFSARLFSRIRSDQGLAYSVGGGIGSNYDHPGAFQISMGTKSGSTVEAINSLYHEMEQVIAGPITPAELERAQESLLNSFVFSVDSKEEILREKMLLEFYGYPLDFIDQFQASIRDVTVEDVQRVAREYLDPDRTRVLVVGRPGDFDADLATLDRGPVRTIDITIPAPGSTSMAPVVTNAEGSALVDRIVSAMGGARAIDGVRSVRRVAKITLNTPQGAMNADVESVESYPSSMKQTITLPMGSMTTIVTPETAVMVTPMGEQPMQASAKEQTLREVRKSPIYVLQNRKADGFQFAARGTEVVDGATLHVLDIDADGIRARWYVDADGHIVRTEGAGTNMMGAPVTQVVVYDDFRRVEGIVQPYSFVIYQDGEQSGSGTVSEIDVNPRLESGFWASGS